MVYIPRWHPLMPPGSIACVVLDDKPAPKLNLFTEWKKFIEVIPIKPLP